MLETLSRTVAVVGHYGSGKTNLSLNLAIALKKQGRGVVGFLRLLHRTEKMLHYGHNLKRRPVCRRTDIFRIRQQIDRIASADDSFLHGNWETG